jgi:hypothetical protein
METKWITLNIHGFTVNNMFEGTKNKKKPFTKEYKIWREKAFRIMKDMPTLEEMNVDPNKPMKIEIIFHHAREYDHHNLDKSFIDVLSLHYGLRDDANFVKRYTEADDEYAKTTDEGTIQFRITNCEGRILNRMDRLWLAIRREDIQI